ncbi:hypothetical protein ABZV31_17810 [Streptomyces sp. NPDC005202]|uniref:hypothetical protein n=1 Tax=Streptomyces sp. NPDC005202 TaxID=3157021 RepID=UPI0033A4C5ED
MTQSGQGEEPSARPAREGIVLPSDGGEPLLPGMTGGPGGRPPAQPTGQVPASSPAGGQAWGQPWGPDQYQTPPPPPGQGWQAPPAQPWGSPEPYQSQAPAPWGTQEQGTPQPPSGTPQPGAGPLPPEGAPAAAHGTQSHAAQPLPPANGHPAAPLPPAGADPYGSPAGQAGLPASAGHGTSPTPGASHPQGGPGALLPPADEGATQYLPPVAAASADEGATQYIPPVTPGALPPEASGDQATRFLGRVPQGGPGGNPDAEATQYLAPVDAQAAGAPPYGGRQTPAEFENLFRSEPGGEAPAAATQQLPRFQQPQAAARPGYAPPGGQDGDGGRGKRTGSRLPLIAAVGVGIAVLGVGAGALLSGGGGDSQSSDKNKTVSATAPATDGSASAPADPVRQQAVELDKLLADSGSSRASVIKAVADVKRCDNLGQAASDLRDAAKQRGELVTRLAQLSVDKLPNHAELTTALTSAWKASASADNHYAAWADQVGGKKGCKKGHARTTGQTQEGNRASGVASAQKVKAAQLWNAIAKTYGLTQRQPTQL